MPRTTDLEAAERRQSVQELDLKGYSARAIANAVGSRPETVKRDLKLIAAQRVRDNNFTSERHRLLQAGRAVEAAAWELMDRLPERDINGRLGSLSKVLAAQERVAKVLGDLIQLDTERKVIKLEQMLETILDAQRGN